MNVDLRLLRLYDDVVIDALSERGERWLTAHDVDGGHVLITAADLPLVLACAGRDGLTVQLRREI